MWSLSFKCRLLILKIRYPFLDRKRSFFCAAFLLSFPHLSVLSISKQRFNEGMKKSIIYESITYWASCLTEYLSNIWAKAFSCGSILFLYIIAVLSCFFLSMSPLEHGLSFFILSECIRHHSELSFRLPYAQWFFPARFGISKIIESLCFLNFKFNRFAFLSNVSLETPHSLDNLFIDRPFFQCKSLITFGNGILKCFSIFSNAGRLTNTPFHI